MKLQGFWLDGGEKWTVVSSKQKRHAARSLFFTDY